MAIEGRTLTDLLLLLFLTYTLIVFYLVPTNLSPYLWKQLLDSVLVYTHLCLVLFFVFWNYILAWSCSSSSWLVYFCLSIFCICCCFNSVRLWLTFNYFSSIFFCIYTFRINCWYSSLNFLFLKSSCFPLAVSTLLSLRSGMCSLKLDSLMIGKIWSYVATICERSISYFSILFSIHNYKLNTKYITVKNS